ncbi:MAG: HPr(Ser) kinase/phosphatase, partial [Ruthenibacterium lactatiformans]|nr:HPr(Ser) kinase/phosphatase [Ruthenibacterium lactatiformans]
MPQFSVSLDKVVEKLRLEVVYTPTELKNIPIYTADVNRPGLLLTGYDEYFDPTRIQIFGNAEVGYLTTLPESERRSHIHTLFAAKPPALIVTRNLSVFDEVLEFASQYEVPVLRSTENTSSLMSALISNLSVEVAPRITRHGVFVEIYGEGILILGESGVGKSETAVELVKRGHRLIADDAVEIKRVSDKTLVGTAPEVIRHFIELRGIGIVDVRRIFGIGAIKMTEKVELVINLEPWEDGKQYDRLGMDSQTTSI